MCHLCPANDVNKPDTEQLTSEATTEFSKHENHSYVKKNTRRMVSRANRKPATALYFRISDRRYS